MKIGKLSLFDSCPKTRSLKLDLSSAYVYPFGLKGDVTQERFAMTIFSATQRCNIVATLFRMVTTLLQHCNAKLR